MIIEDVFLKDGASKYRIVEDANGEFQVQKDMTDCGHWHTVGGPFKDFRDAQYFRNTKQIVRVVE